MNSDGAAVGLHLGQQLIVVETIRALRAERVFARRRQIVRDEDALGDPPVVRIGHCPDPLATLDIFRPMGGNPFGQKKIGGDGKPATSRRFRHALRMGSNHCHHDRRVGLLERLCDDALADLFHRRSFGGDLPETSVDGVRRAAAPDLQHCVDSLDEHRISVCVEIAENFGVREESARADAKIESAIEHVIQHRDLPGNRRRMTIGQVDGSCAEPHLLDVLCDPGQKQPAGRYILRLVGDVFPAIGFRETQFIRQDEGLSVFLESNPPVLVQRVNRHREETKLHSKLPKPRKNA